MIVPVYKPIGASTHQLAALVGACYQEKATHTGTLDPMADGVVIVLTGQDRFQKEKLARQWKTYQFEVLVGVKTDSHDLLGLPQLSLSTLRKVHQMDDQKIITNIKSILPNYLGQQTQKRPRFSAKRIGGKSAFDKAKENKQFDAGTQRVYVHDIKLIDSKRYNLPTLQKEVIEKLQTVTGDFRQKQILQEWNKLFQNLASSGENQSGLLLTLEARVGRRTYIRALVRDIFQELKLPATTFSLTRTINGPYNISDCVCFSAHILPKGIGKNDQKV